MQEMGGYVIRKFHEGVVVPQYKYNINTWVGKVFTLQFLLILKALFCLSNTVSGVSFVLGCVFK